MKLTSPTKGEMTLTEVVEDIKNYIKESSVPVEIVVGTDSQNTDQTKFVVVLAMYRFGQGGRFFYHVEKTKLVKDLRTKIYQETQMTLNFAEKLTTEMIEQDVLHNIIIHCDLGTVGKTKDLIAEIKGWVVGEGYEVYIKPECYAACAIANMLTK